MSPHQFVLETKEKRSFMAEQLPQARLVPSCSLCQRGDLPSGRLGLTTLPAHGELIVVCRVCWLCVTVRELATGGDVAEPTLWNVEAVLDATYQRLRRELEQVHSGTPHNDTSQ